jgi:serine-type D-Ala-D-Ala carboxypeptidase/endopeptidase (penicillin-binding protein 4)
MKRTILYLALVAALFVDSHAQTAEPSRPRTLPTPTPTPAANTTPLPANGQTLAELQANIRSRLLRPELRRGRVGVKIASLATGKEIFAADADKYFMPASNMKNFTVAAAIEKLGPDYRIVTSVFAQSPPDASGTIRGNVRVYGRGDVSISTAFFGTSPNDPETYYKGIDRLADAIAAAGVKRIEGDLIGDDTYFSGDALPGTWEWDDLQWYYGAEVSALPVNDNAVDLTVRPSGPGVQCAVNLTPINPVIRIVNTCTTTAAGTLRTLRIEKLINQNVIEISGNLPVGNNGFSGSVTVTRPADLFAFLLRQRLERRGVAITGTAKAISKTNGAASPLEMTEIAKLTSPPLSEIAGKTLKPSQNMYTETLLRTLGENERIKAIFPADRPQPTSEALGLSSVHTFLTGIGLPEDAIIQHDGSGLSRHDLITPEAVVRLYTYMARESRNAQVWRDALTIAGVDGTLKNRFVGTRASGNVRGKTGTIDQVSALSGYVTTAGGEQLAFSFVVNGVNEGPVRTRASDDIVLMLAGFTGKID